LQEAQAGLRKDRQREQLEVSTGPLVAAYPAHDCRYAHGMIGGREKMGGFRFERAANLAFKPSP
jgi:hypothetical protein